MFKSLISPSPSITGFSLVIFFPSSDISTSLSLSLFTNNHSLKNIGYLYSEGLNPVISNSTQENSSEIYLEQNGTLFLDEEKKQLFMDLTGGVAKKGVDVFLEDLTGFIKKYNLKKLVLVTSSSTENIEDTDIVSKEVNVYFTTNLEGFKSDVKLSDIKQAFKIPEEKRKNQTYHEMNLVGCPKSLKKLVQKFLLEDIKFLFIFSFSDIFSSLFVGYALFRKIETYIGYRKEDEIVIKKEINKMDVINFIENKGLKVERGLKDLLYSY